jgi:hypothetical protein
MVCNIMITYQDQPIDFRGLESTKKLSVMANVGTTHKAIKTRGTMASCRSVGETPPALAGVSLRSTGWRS